MEAPAVVFFHAHPDDEAIFTGGTIVRLARAGARPVVVFATMGERGEVPEGLPAGDDIARRRAAESHRAAELLGVARVEFLGYQDSGMPGDAANNRPTSFAMTDPNEAAERLAGILAEEDASAVVVYDAGGIYGHPDHVQVHRVGVRAAALVGVPTVYQATVDREYLHFVETHLVGEASAAAIPMPTVGVPTVYVTTTVDVRDVVDLKRRAISVHSSQIPETSSAMSLAPDAFAGVYGYEWYVRDGPPGPIEDLLVEREV